MGMGRVLCLQDYAFAGIGVGTATMLCMNPLDLLKVKFQVSTHGPEVIIGRRIWCTLPDIYASEGWRQLYRGLGPNVPGNTSSWAHYFHCEFFSPRPSFCFASRDLFPTQTPRGCLSSRQALLFCPAVFYTLQKRVRGLLVCFLCSSLLTSAICQYCNSQPDKPDTVWTAPPNSPDSHASKIGSVAIQPCNQPLAQGGLTGFNPATVPVPCAS